MEIYLVGGAVRDRLLGLPVKERDWVVVGATSQEMLSRGYRPVGRDFPVFLHPQTKEEYALARTERKTAPGYRGFTVHADPGVTLTEDLRRRDLTINALAEDTRGNLIDYYGGLEDLKARRLRHTSAAFMEDPVRVLRVARFAARFKTLGFQVVPETLELMHEIVANGELRALVPERVWLELVKALGEDTPTEFFQVLRACGALAVIFPEIDHLWGVPQRPEYHPEIDTGVHTMMVLAQAGQLSADPRVRFAALTHDLGKGTTPREQWPRHPGHEARGAVLVAQLCARLRAPRAYRHLAVLAARYHPRCHRILELRPATVLDTLLATDALRRPKRFEDLLIACEADYRGRARPPHRPYPQAGWWRGALRAANGVDIKSLVAAGLQGPALGQRLRQLRIQAIRKALRPIHDSLT
jgi:tRNA nucleotidyltransferase (CCA-adding enzyme)